MRLSTLAEPYMDPKAELTKQYLMRADDDLRISEIIINDLEPIY